MSGFRFEPIGVEHNLQFFGCGIDSLDRWLNKEALNAHRGGLSRTHVSVRDDDPDLHVMGYFALSPTVVTEKVKGRGSRKDGWDLTPCVGHAQSQECAGGSEMIQPDGKEKLPR